MTKTTRYSSNLDDYIESLQDPTILSLIADGAEFATELLAIYKNNDKANSFLDAARILRNLRQEASQCGFIHNPGLW